MKKKMIYILLTVLVFILVGVLFYIFNPKQELKEDTKEELIPYPTGVIAESYFVKDQNTIYFQRGNKIFKYKINSDEITKVLHFEIEDLNQIYFKVKLGENRFCICYNFQINTPEENATILKIFDYEGNLLEKKTTNLTICPLECSEDLILETSLPILKHILYRWNGKEPEEIDENDNKVGKTKNGEQIEIGGSNIKNLIPDIKNFQEIIGYKNIIVLRDLGGELWILQIPN
jgi:hypothetical protein